MQNKKNVHILTDRDAAKELVRVNQTLKALQRSVQNAIDFLDKKTDQKRRNPSFNSR